MKDVFLSHASLDKETCVRPLGKELELAGVSFWLDEAEIAWGESIASKINEGLKDSRYVVVFISPAFIGRAWPEKELFAALHQQVTAGSNRVLPVVIGDPREVLRPYPLIAGLSYRLWHMGAKALAMEIAAHLKSEDTKVGRLVQSCLQDYFGRVTARDLANAYGLFAERFRAATAVTAYSDVFGKTIKAEMLEFRLINTIDDLAYCHLSVAATDIDGNVENWRGSVEMVREHGQWAILTMKGLKQSL